MSHQTHIHLLNHEHTCAFGSSFSTSCVIAVNVPRDTKSASRFTKIDDLLKLQDNHGIKKINHQISDTVQSVITEYPLRRWCTFQQVRNLISL